MSRSRRKTPIFGYSSAPSDHTWKKLAARKFRRQVKARLHASLEDAPLPVRGRDVINPWDAPKDGKGWFGAATPRQMRK